MFRVKTPFHNAFSDTCEHRVLAHEMEKENRALSKKVKRRVKTIYKLPKS